MSTQGNALNISAASPLSPLLGGTGESSAVSIPTQVQQGTFNYSLAGGAADAYTVTLDPVPSALTEGLIVTMTANHSNTTNAPTLNVNGLGAVTIEAFGNVLVANDIVNGADYILFYDLANNLFNLLNPSVSVANTASVQSSVYNLSADTGAVNAYVATLLVVPPVPLQNGVFVFLEVANTNTGASTLVINGSAATPIVTIDGAALVGGEMVAGGISFLFVFGGNVMLLNPNSVGSVSPGTANQLAYYSATGSVVSGLAGANSAMLVTDATGVPAMTASMTDGQVIIGATGGTPAPANLSAGAGIAIVNAGGSVTISATGTGIGWATVAGTSQAMVADGAYIPLNGALTTFTLPATAAVGTTLNIAGYGGGGWAIAQNAGQSIVVGTSTSTVGAGGSVSSSDASDNIYLVCVVADLTWTVVAAPQGVLTVI